MHLLTSVIKIVSVKNLLLQAIPQQMNLNELNVQTVKNKLVSMSTSSNSITNKVRKNFFRYCVTPLACGKSPAELLYM